MMAQLVEQRIRNAWVAGSSPARGSFCEISTSVVHGLPKPGRRVRFPYLAPSPMLFQTAWDFFCSRSPKDRQETPTPCFSLFYIKNPYSFA